MQALIFPLFNFVANNRWAQIALGVGIFYALWRWNEEAAERRGARRTEQRMEKKSRATKEKVITKMKENADERVEEARQARMEAERPVDPPDRGLPSDSLPDDIADKYLS